MKVEIPEVAIVAGARRVGTSPRKAVYEIAYAIAEECIRGAYPHIVADIQERLLERHTIEAVAHVRYGLDTETFMHALEELLLDTLSPQRRTPDG